MPAEECKESAQQGEGAVVEAAASIIAWYYSRGGADPFDDERADDESGDSGTTDTNHRSALIAIGMPSS